MKFDKLAVIALAFDAVTILFAMLSITYNLTPIFALAFGVVAIYLNSKYNRKRKKELKERQEKINSFNSIK